MNYFVEIVLGDGQISKAFTIEAEYFDQKPSGDVDFFVGDTCLGSVITRALDATVIVIPHTGELAPPASEAAAEPMHATPHEEVHIPEA